MASELSIRQLLACLDVSVFDPAMEPALKKAGDIEAEQEKENTDSFHTVPLLVVMAFAASLCFYGLKAYPFAAGLPLFVFCRMALQKTTSALKRFFLRTYFSCGFFLLIKGLFDISPVLTTALLFVFLVYSLFKPAGRWQKAVLSVSFFFCMSFLCRNILFLGMSLFSIAGTIAFLFPLKNTGGRITETVFTVFPLLLVLAGDILSVSTGMPRIQGEWMMALTLAVEALLPLFALWRDTEVNERFLFLTGAVALFLCGSFVSVGIEGCCVLFLIAFFINSAALAKTAMILIACFLATLVLSLPVSLFSAAVVCVVTGGAFEFLRYRSGRFAAKKE